MGQSGIPPINQNNMVPLYHQAPIQQTPYVNQYQGPQQHHENINQMYGQMQNQFGNYIQQRQMSQQQIDFEYMRQMKNVAEIRQRSQPPDINDLNFHNQIIGENIPSQNIIQGGQEGILQFQLSVNYGNASAPGQVGNVNQNQLSGSQLLELFKNHNKSCRMIENQPPQVKLQINSSHSNFLNLIVGSEDQLGNQINLEQSNNQLLSSQDGLINKVKRIDKIQFNEHTSKLTQEKGEPIKNQVTPFKEITDQEQWELPVRVNLGNENSHQSSKLRKEEELIFESQKKQNDSAIFQIIQKIIEDTDKINLKQINFEKELYDYEERLLQIKIRDEIKLENQNKIKRSNSFSNKISKKQQISLQCSGKKLISQSSEQAQIYKIENAPPNSVKSQSIKSIKIEEQKKIESNNSKEENKQESSQISQIIEEKGSELQNQDFTNMAQMSEKQNIFLSHEKEIENSQSDKQIVPKTERTVLNQDNDHNIIEQEKEDKVEDNVQQIDEQDENNDNDQEQIEQQKLDKTISLEDIDQQIIQIQNDQNKKNVDEASENILQELNKRKISAKSSNYSLVFGQSISNTSSDQELENISSTSSKKSQKIGSIKKTKKSQFTPLNNIIDEEMEDYNSKNDLPFLSKKLSAPKPKSKINRKLTLHQINSSIKLEKQISLINQISGNKSQGGDSETVKLECSNDHRIRASSIEERILSVFILDVVDDGEDEIVDAQIKHQKKISNKELVSIKNRQKKHSELKIRQNKIAHAQKKLDNYIPPKKPIKDSILKCKQKVVNTKRKNSIQIMNTYIYQNLLDSSSSESEKPSIKQQMIDEQEEFKILEAIKRKVQLGGNLVHEEFNSFGECDIDNEIDSDEESKEDQRSFQYQQTMSMESTSKVFSDKGLRVKSGVVANFVQDPMNISRKSNQSQKDKTIQSFDFNLSQQKVVKFEIDQQMYESPDGKTPEKVSEEQKNSDRFVSAKQSKKNKFKDTTLNHSKLVRRMEKKLKSMFIDVNVGIIIQMNLQEKIKLKEQIDKVWNFREKNDSQYKLKLKNKKKDKYQRFNLSDYNRNLHLDYDQISSSIDQTKKESDKMPSNSSIKSSKSSEFKNRRKRGRRVKLTREQKMKMLKPLCASQDNVGQEFAGSSMSIGMRSGSSMSIGMRSGSSIGLLQIKEKKKTLKHQKQFSSGSHVGESVASKQQLFSVFEVDYDFYFKNNHGLFVVQTNMQQRIFKQIKKKTNIQNLLQNIPQFKEMKKELYKEDIYRKQNTLCFDIQNVFIRKVNITDSDEFNNLKNAVDIEINYVIIQNQPGNDYELLQRINQHETQKKQGLENLEINKKKLKEIIKNYDTKNKVSTQVLGNLPIVSNCCQLGKRKKLCLCSKTIYQVRPYVFEILRALQPFFEIIALSNMPNYELEQIIDHIEIVLNKPIIEMINRQAIQKKELKQVWGQIQKQNLDENAKKKMQIQIMKNKRLTKQFETKVYFQFILNDSNYVHIAEGNEHIENLFLLTSKRNEGNIFLLTSNNFRIVAAKENGFCVIPITKYSNDMKKDIQLNLVENYLLLLRYTNDMKSKNNIDFGYLTQKLRIKKQESAEKISQSEHKVKDSVEDSRRYSCSDQSFQKREREERDNYSFGKQSLDNVQEDSFENQKSSENKSQDDDKSKKSNPFN